MTAKPKANRSERFKLLNTFVDHAARCFKPIDGMVWLVLFRDARPTRDGGGLATTSVGWIAERVGVCDRSVYGSLRRLAAAGLIEQKRRGGQGRGVSVWKLVAQKSVADQPAKAFSEQPAKIGM
ncbi:MAG: hypothetical protein ACRC1K_11325 [Planctomycetia bacterium]